MNIMCIIIFITKMNKIMLSANIVRGYKFSIQMLENVQYKRTNNLTMGS